MNTLYMPEDDTLKEQESYLKSTYNTILTTVWNENADIEEKTPDNPINNSILDKRRAYYYKESSESLIQIYTVLFIIYIVMAVILSIYLMFKPYDTVFKVGVIAIIILFPLYMINAQKYVFSFITYIYNYMKRFAYNNGYHIKDSNEKDDILKPLPKKPVYVSASRNVERSSRWSSGLEYTPKSGTVVSGDVSGPSAPGVSTKSTTTVTHNQKAFDTEVNNINTLVGEVINQANAAVSSNASSFNMFENILQKKLGTFELLQLYIRDKNHEKLYKCTTSLATLSTVIFAYVISQREMSSEIQTEWVEICNKISIICNSISSLTQNNIFKSAADRTRETYNKMAGRSSLNDQLLIEYTIFSINKMNNEVNLIDPNSQKTQERYIIDSAKKILVSINPLTDGITDTSAFGLSVQIYASLAIEYCVFSKNIYECILAITVSKAYAPIMDYAAIMNLLNSTEDIAIAISKNKQEEIDSFIKELQLEICQNISKKIIPTLTDIDPVYIVYIRESAEVSVATLTRDSTSNSEKNQMSLLMSSLETCININFTTPSSISLYAFYHILGCATSYFKIKGIHVGDRFKHIYDILRDIEKTDANDDQSVNRDFFNSIIDKYTTQINTVLGEGYSNLKNAVTKISSFSKSISIENNILPSFSAILSIGTAGALVVESTVTSDATIKQSITTDVKKSIDRTMTLISNYPNINDIIAALTNLNGKNMETFCSRPSTRSHYDGFTYTKHVLTYSFL